MEENEKKDYRLHLINTIDNAIDNGISVYDLDVVNKKAIRHNYINKQAVIDLMAEYISKRDVEEDICMKNKTNPDWCNEDYTNCQDCIKKYFADLVEKE